MFTSSHRLASVAHVAADIGASDRTIRRWIKRGLLPATKVGGKVLIKLSDVDALLAKGKIQAVDDPGTSGLN